MSLYENLNRRQKNLNLTTKSQIYELSKYDKFDFGCHTSSHFDFGSYEQKITPDLIATEFENDYNSLTTLLSKPIQFFAYPRGRKEHLHRNILLWMSQQVMFTHAFSTIPAALTLDSPRFLMPRYSMEFKYSPEYWRRFLSGYFDQDPAKIFKDLIHDCF